VSRLDCLYVHQERQFSIFRSFVDILIPAYKAKYAYRSIAEFVKHVSTHDDEYLRRNPFPAHDIQSSLGTAEEQSDGLERGIGTTRLQKTFSSEQFSIPGNRSQGIEDGTVSPDLMIQLAQNL